MDMCIKRRVDMPIERHTDKIYTRRIQEKFYNELYESDGYVIKTIDDNGLFEVAHSAYNDNPNQLHVMVRYDGGDDDNLDQSCFVVRYDGGDIITCDFTCTFTEGEG